MSPYGVLEIIAVPVALMSVAVAVLGINAPPSWAFRLVPLAALMQSALVALSSKTMEAGFGFWLMVPIWLLFWGVIIGAGLVRMFKCATPPAAAAAKGSDVPRAVDIAFGALASAILALWIALWLHAIFEGNASPVPVHWGVAGFSVCFILAVLWIAPVRAKGWSTGGAVLCALVAWSTAQPDRMMANAARAAQGAPWCIALQRPDYLLERPQQAFALTAQAEGTTLVVGPAPYATYHWSRSFQAFRANRIISRSGPWSPENRTLTCRPHENFAQTVAGNTARDTVSARIGGLWYDIPRAFQPIVFSALAIKASLPDVAPVSRQRAPSHPLSHSILMEPARMDGQPHSIMDVAPGPPEVEGPLGLQAFASQHGFPVLAKTGPNGLIAIKINCIPSRPEPIRCQHRFVRDRALYSFAHPQEMLPQWREMQNSIAARFESFRADVP